MPTAAASVPPDVRAWSGVEVVQQLVGGARNPVYLARRGTEQFVIRVSGRSPAALAWELQLLDAVDAAGLVVPRIVPTDDGRRHDRGVLVQRFLDGAPPRDRRDWARVITAVEALHEATADWPQRPGFASAAELLHRSSGGDVRLDAMPADAVDLIRSSWRAVLTDDHRQCAIHGDLGGGNVLVTDRQVALIDWDEARVDSPAFDFAHIPSDVPVPIAGDRDTLVTAGVAWEAATCWTAEPEYAARRLAELRARTR